MRPYIVEALEWWAAKKEELKHVVQAEHFWSYVSEAFSELMHLYAEKEQWQKDRIVFLDEIHRLEDALKDIKRRHALCGIENLHNEAQGMLVESLVEDGKRLRAEIDGLRSDIREHMIDCKSAQDAVDAGPNP